MRVPDLTVLAAPTTGPTLRAVSETWQASRVDVRESTTIQHRTALGRVLPILGMRTVDSITVDDVQDLVDTLHLDGKARESIRKSRTALAMVLDYARVRPNPARDKLVKLPLSEPDEVEPPIADHVEAVGWILSVPYLLGVLILDATGCRIGELAAAKVGDLDEGRKAWLVRAKVAKTRKARWVELPDDLYRVVVDRLPAREDRELEAPLFPIGSDDRLRMAISRACKRRRSAVVEPARPPAPPDQPPASRGRLVGRDRRPRRSAQPLRDGRPLHTRDDGLPGDRPPEAARSCCYGAPLRAPLGVRKRRFCRHVVGQYRPFSGAR